EAFVLGELPHQAAVAQLPLDHLLPQKAGRFAWRWRSRTPFAHHGRVLELIVLERRRCRRRNVVATPTHQRIAIPRPGGAHLIDVEQRMPTTVAVCDRDGSRGRPLAHLAFRDAERLGKLRHAYERHQSAFRPSSSSANVVLPMACRATPRANFCQRRTM